MLSSASRSLSKFVLPEKLQDFWNFTLFQTKKHQHASSNPVYHQHFYLVVHIIFSKKVFHWSRTSWVCLALYLKSPLLDSLLHMVITSFYTNWSIWIQLEKGQDAEKLREGGGGDKKALEMGGQSIMGDC